VKRQNVPMLVGMTPDPFETSLAAAQRGGSDGFADLYRTFQPALLRHLRVVAPGDAEDIAAETWVSVMNDLRTFEGTEPAFRAWLFTIARHRLIDARRAGARRPSVPVADFPPDAQQMASGATVDPADEVLDRLRSDDVVALVRTLPPDQAEAVSLRVLAGLSVADVAAHMERSPGAVRVLSHRGLRALGASLSRRRANATTGTRTE
jgi:RNA polymerase sigma-70 factor, ECF subfamily